MRLFQGLIKIIYGYYPEQQMLAISYGIILFQRQENMASTPTSLFLSHTKMKKKLASKYSHEEQSLDLQGGGEDQHSLTYLWSENH